MIPIEIVTDFVNENFQKVSISKNGSHFLARCSLCGDSKVSPNKRRFNLDYNDGKPIYHCFNCGRSGSFIELYSEIKGISVNEAKRILLRNTFNTAIETITKKSTTITINATNETVDHSYILSDCIDSKSTYAGSVERVCQKMLQNFMKERHIPSNFPVFYAYKGKYQGRVIIPVYDGDKIVYFQGRSLIPGIKPKYLNPSIKKDSIIFNKNNFDRNKFIIVTEGILDAIVVGNQGTCIFGSSVDDNMIKELSKLTDRGIIIALDNDNAGMQAVLSILRKPFSNTLYFFTFPHKYKEIKDLNELITRHSIDNVYDFVVSNSMSKFEFITKIGLGGMNV